MEIPSSRRREEDDVATEREVGVGMFGGVDVEDPACPAGVTAYCESHYSLVVEVDG